MSQPAPVRGYRVGVVLAILATVGIPRTSFSQQELEGEGLALDLLERLEYTRAGADAVTASMSLVQFEEQYCLPPDPPGKAREEQFLKSREATLAEYRNRYNRLRVQLLNLIRRDGGARRVVDQKFAGNPEDAQAWDPWFRAFTRASKAIGEKRKELNAIPVVRCRALEPQQTAPDPAPPTGPGIELPEPKVRPVAYPTFKTPFCSEDEKQKVIQQFRAVAWDYYMNYQDAREYYDAIREALSQGRGNASVLRSLLPGARKSLDDHTKALDDFNKELDRVRALRVIDCEQTPQTTPDPIPPLLFDPFVFPAVPPQFCTQEAKDETVRQLEAARNTARRNYDKAAARITELGGRITRGDSSTATSAAFQEANDRASEWLQQSRALDADMQRAAATPVVECANQVQRIGLARPGVGNGPGVRAGFIYNWANFSRFQGMVGDQEGIATASSDESVNQFGIFGELDYGRWIYGGGIRTGRHYFTQTYQPGGGRPSRGEGTVDGFFGDFYAGRRWRPWPMIDFSAWTGPVLTLNLGDFDWYYGDALIATRRRHSSVKWGAGLNVDIGPKAGWYGRFGVNHVSVNSDADDHTGFNFGVVREFGRGPQRFAQPGRVPGPPNQNPSDRIRSDSTRSSTRRPQS